MEARIVLAVALALLAPLGASGGVPAQEWHVVAYDGPVPPEERAFLESLAGPVLDHAPPFGYVVRLSEEARRALEARPAVAGVHPASPDAKASRDLGPGTRSVRVLLFPGATPDLMAEHLLREGAASAVAADGPEPVVDVGLGKLPLAHVLHHAETRWVETLRDRAELDNARASSLVQSGTDADWSVHDLGVDGSTQIVAYCDSGLDTDAPAATLAGRTVHEQFADPTAPLVHNVPSPLHRKVALYYSPVDSGGVRGDMDDAQGHGTHVAGTLAGDAGAWGVRDGHDGVAFAARLAVCDATRGVSFQVLADYGAYWRPAYDVGARVHSNSWGTLPSDEYTLAARQHDAYAWEHRDFLILRSMGNAGPDGVMRPEAAAKSVLAVGATTNDAANLSVVSFSTRGPAADGRVKPDLVAPGSCVTSAAPPGSASYACWSGTSHSTPVVAGAAALVRDFFAKQDPPRHVSSALVRATLVASAQPIAAAAPDGVEGWGRPQLGTALGALLLAQDEDAGLLTGDAWTTTMEVAQGASLRVVLAWTDHPAAPGASPALVNDLDLEVETPLGAVLLGNADLAAPDRANVVERVLAEGLDAGTYTLRVRGWNVPMGPQPFALVVVRE